MTKYLFVLAAVLAVCVGCETCASGDDEGCAVLPPDEDAIDDHTVGDDTAVVDEDLQPTSYIKIEGNMVSVVLPKDHNCTYSYCETSGYLVQNVHLYQGERRIVTGFYTQTDVENILIDGELHTISSGYPCGTMGCDVYATQKIPTPTVRMVEYVYLGMVDYETTDCDGPVSQVPSYETNTDLSGHFAIEFAADNCYGVNRLEFDYPPTK